MEVEMPVPAEVFKRAMRHFPAAVNIVTCADDGEWRGLTATAVCSLCVEPIPSLLVCVNRSGSTYSCLRNSKAFAVNVLDASQQDIAKLFASPKPEDRDRRFTAGRWSQLTSGAPILDGAVVTFDCELSQEIEHGTHSILVGTVVDIRMGTSEAHLMYVGGAFAEIPTRVSCFT
jgi:flavin reductase (DIM6/NTAB) family NADH-FMN oxidoreductase RutF